MKKKRCLNLFERKKYKKMFRIEKQNRFEEFKRKQKKKKRKEKNSENSN